MGALTVTTRLQIAFLLFAVAFATACGGRRPNDEMDAARAALQASADAEPCAEAEYRAAASLLQQAEEAYAARDYSRARRLAESASQQAEYARQVAIDNAENCNRVRDITAEVDERRDARDQAAQPVDTNYEFVPVFFDFDAAELTADGQRILNSHAAQLTRNPDWSIQVEGHCDNRGTTQYNLALGDRRARTVKDYLVRMGVDPQRITTVSYGAEVPISADHNRNRRAQFNVRR